MPQSQGTRVAVYGSFARPSSPDVSEYVGTTSVYTIDGANNVTYTTPFQTTIRRYTRFYQSDLLPYGKHILHVDVLSGMDYELDWIEYNVTVPMTSSSSLSSTTSSPSTISAPEPTSPSESTSSPSPTPSSGSSAADATEASSKGSVNVGAAVGGAIGGLALLSLGAIVAYLLWRKRRAPNRSTGMGGSVETGMCSVRVRWKKCEEADEISSRCYGLQRAFDKSNPAGGEICGRRMRLRAATVVDVQAPSMTPYDILQCTLQSGGGDPEVLVLVSDRQMTSAKMHPRGDVCLRMLGSQASAFLFWHKRKVDFTTYRVTEA